MTGAELIAAEREQQIAQGWTADTDDGHDELDLVFAAVAYAVPESLGHWFPWADRFKPSETDTIQNLARAGALIAAQIDKMQRAEKLPT